MQNRAPVNSLLLSILYMVEVGRIVPWGCPLPNEDPCLVEGETAFYLRQKDLPDILKAYCYKTGEPYIRMTSQEMGKLLSQADVCTKYYEGTEIRLAKKYTKDYGNTRLMELPKEKIKNQLGRLQRV